MNIVQVFSLAQNFVSFLPETITRTVFTTVGAALGYSNLKGVVQLRKNYQRIVPLSSTWAQRRRSAQAMANYFAYYHEVFRLKDLTPQQILARVRTENMEQLRETLTQKSCTAALLHAGNWDLAGAWACLDLAPVHTLAEKLEPVELAQRYLEFRQHLGMKIYFAEKGKNSLGLLQNDMQESKCFVPLLMDRDLSASGLEVDLLGAAMRVAPGGAILAIKKQCPMFPIFLARENFAYDKARVKKAGSKWGIVLRAGEPIYPPALSEVGTDTRAPAFQAALHAMCTAWMEQVAVFLQDNLTDWHMLQKVFTADLDMQRLAAKQVKNLDN